MNERAPPRITERNWTIAEQGAVLLNRLPNSTSVSGNQLEVANDHLINTTRLRDEAETQHQHLREMVAQADEAGRQARANVERHAGYLTRTRNERTRALTQYTNQQVRFVTLREANTGIMVQHLAELHVQQLVRDQRHLARTMCDFIADGVDYPLFHTRETRCSRMRLMPCGKTMTPSLEHLVNLNIFIARRAPVGYGTEYGLAPQFADTLPVPPRFNVPEPPLRYRYEALNKTSSNESNDEGDG